MAKGGMLRAVLDRFKSPKNFDAGHLHGRRLRSIPNNRLAINTQTRFYGPTVLARSRYLCANNGYIASAKESFIAALIGDGIKPSWLIADKATKKTFQLAWRDWTDDADADATTDFYGLQYLIAGELFEAGECFVRLRPRKMSDGYNVPLQLQLLPAEMCPVQYNLWSGGAGVARIECGIEYDAIGRRINYYFYRSHPGENFQFMSGGTQLLTSVPASQILHIRIPMRAAQIRGLPKTLSSIATMALLDLYDDAELERKRTAALFGAFVTRTGNEGDDDHPLGVPDTGRDKEQFTLEPGVVADLEVGEDIKFAEPADVGGNYDAFQYRNLTRGASGMGVPYSAMTGDLRQTSFGSIRAGTIDHKRRTSALQNHFMVHQFCRPVAKVWCDTAVLYKAVPIAPADYDANARDYTRIKWIASKWDWIDPLKDQQAESLAVTQGFKARSDVIEEGGDDAEETDERIAADKNRADSLGLTFPIGVATNTPGSSEEPSGGSGESSSG